MKPHIPFRVPRPEAVSIALVVALSLSLPVLQYLDYRMSRYVPLPRGNYQDAPNKTVGATFLLFYLAELGVSLQRGDYENATGLIAELLKRQPNLEPMLRMYLVLLREIVESLNSLERTLQEATILVGNGKLDEARVKIYQAKIVSDETHEKLSTASTSIDRIQSAYGVDLKDQIAVLQILVSRLAEYKVKLQILEKATSKMDVRKPTYLMIQPPDSTVWVDSTARLTGLLTCDEGPLAKRTVQFMAQGVSGPLQEVFTDHEGRCAIDFLVSPTFGKEPTVNARYSPLGDDAETYRPSQSNAVSLQILYYPTKLAIKLSHKKVHLEEMVYVSGFLTGLSGIPLENRTVKLVVKGNVLNETMTERRGGYELSFAFHSPASSGTYPVHTVFTPVTDRYSEVTSEETHVELYYFPTRIRVTRSSSWSFSGGPASIEGIVDVGSEGLVKKQLVSIFLGGSEVARAEAEKIGPFGVYKVTFSVPLRVSGTQDLTVSLVPPAPWYDPSATTVQVTIYNSITVALSIVATGVCTLIILRTPFPVHLRRRGKPRRATVASIEAEPVRLLHEQPPTLNLAWIRGREDNRDRVRATYAMAKAFIEYVVGYASKPSATHWEFLQEVKSKVEGSEPNLRALTLLFEVAEYSDYPCSIEDSEQAISEAEAIFRKLGERLE
jgi:hypothetical protein